ncbi:MAG: hypothetical protein B7Z10_09820 [Rhodobacterales bacterium 32-66-7]|nr:MAG: hypothetical protein B7Z31_07240 [Rhodobacterales bacterium 12-65-15]OYX24152.1 MAG: hypothetical protein B7Z10_09820 [Rhodobacterales bacterium 32-66-7]OZA09009.1 MAG: hypothetical protein B7Y02_12145 [Rhodobacterales bacterium 17-64-5]
MTPLQPYPSRPPLHLDYLPGRNPMLVLAFTGVGNRIDPIPAPEAVKLAGWDGENHVLFISDASRSWMNAPGLVETLLEAVARLVQAIQPDRIVAFGNSMGGSAALIYASLARVDSLLAIVPQYSVQSDLVPEERRWWHFREHITDWRFPAVPDLTGRNCQAMILHGGEPREIIHARRFKTGPGTDHYIVPQYGHALAQCLKAKRHLRPLISHVFNGEMAEARAVVEAAGGIRFAHYRQQRRVARQERRDHAAKV